MFFCQVFKTRFAICWMGLSAYFGCPPLNKSEPQSGVGNLKSNFFRSSSSSYPPSSTEEAWVMLVSYMSTWRRWNVGLCQHEKNAHKHIYIYIYEYVCIWACVENGCHFGTMKYKTHRIHAAGRFTYIELVFTVNVGKYISPMDSTGKSLTFSS